MPSLLSPARLKSARTRIEVQFLDQVTNGAQTKGLPGPRYAACGQYLGQLTSPHRGLHGTAAAILVLSRSDLPGAKEATRCLLEYVRSRASVEASVLTRHKLESDRKHVIKCAEMLKALLTAREHGFDIGTAAEEHADELMIAQLRLKNGVTGWPYFSGDLSVEILPTALAATALERAGRPQPEAIAFLLEQLAEETTRKDIASEFSLQIEAINALLEIADGARIDPNVLRRTLSALVNRYRPLLSSDIEARFECMDPHNQWVHIRVAWQLSLLESTLRATPSRVVTQPELRSLLKRVIEATEGSSGYRYPFSGRGLSTRTSAAVHEVLLIGQTSTVFRRWLHASATALAAIRQAFSSRALRLLVRVGALIVMAAAFFRWFNGDASLADLAPSLGVTVLLAGLSSSRR
jgi:hypothetical protein